MGVARWYSGCCDDWMLAMVNVCAAVPREEIMRLAHLVATWVLCFMSCLSIAKGSFISFDLGSTPMTFWQIFPTKSPEIINIDLAPRDFLRSFSRSKSDNRGACEGTSINGSTVLLATFYKYFGIHSFMVGIGYDRRGNRPIQPMREVRVGPTLNLFN